MGLLMSEVLSTLLSAKFVFAAATVLAPVPPFATATTPVNLPAATDTIFASVIDPSAVETPATAASTYVLTAFCVGNKTSLTPSVVVADLFAAFSLRSSAACVNVLIGLLISEVLSTLLIAKFVFAPAIVLDPVPPFAMATTPVSLPADTLTIFASVIEASAIAVLAIAAST